MSPIEQARHDERLALRALRQVADALVTQLEAYGDKWGPSPAALRAAITAADVATAQLNTVVDETIAEAQAAQWADWHHENVPFYDAPIYAEEVA